MADKPSTSNLYKSPTLVTLKSGEQVKMYVPTIQQHALVVEVIVGGTKNMFYTEKELKDMTYDKVLTLCMAKYKQMASEDTEDNRTKIGMFFVNEKTITIINRLLKQSFPDIQPLLLKQDVYMELFELILSETSKVMG